MFEKIRNKLMPFSVAYNRNTYRSDFSNERCPLTIHNFSKNNQSFMKVVLSDLKLSSDEFYKLPLNEQTNIFTRHLQVRPLDRVRVFIVNILNIRSKRNRVMKKLVSMLLSGRYINSDRVEKITLENGSQATRFYRNNKLIKEIVLKNNV